MTEPASDELINEMQGFVDQGKPLIMLSMADVTALIARIRQQDAELERLEGSNISLFVANVDLSDEIERLRAEAKRSDNHDKEVLARLLRIEAALKGGEA
ncbi:MAG: hypothetical protein WC829_01795 [Hyphomicrobium sp.]|jgi:uncharacterized small protein (DUF1192 family)